MSVEKQLPSLYKLHLFHKEIPDDFSDEYDLDGYFYRNIFDISQPQLRIVRVSKGSNKIHRIEVVRILRYKDTAALYLSRRSGNLKKISSLVDTLGDFLKTFDKAGKCLKVP